MAFYALKYKHCLYYNYNTFKLGLLNVFTHLNVFYLFFTINRSVFYIFYDNLKTICDEQGVKITPIVDECGGAKGSIYNWKKGASPNSDIVAKLAVRLNVSTDLLIV